MLIVHGGEQTSQSYLSAPLRNHHGDIRDASVQIGCSISHSPSMLPYSVSKDLPRCFWNCLFNVSLLQHTGHIIEGNDCVLYAISVLLVGWQCLDPTILIRLGWVIQPGFNPTSFPFLTTQFLEYYFERSGLAHCFGVMFQWPVPPQVSLLIMLGCQEWSRGESVLQ